MMAGITSLHACWKTHTVPSSDHSEKHTAALLGAQPPGLDATAQSSHTYPAFPSLEMGQLHGHGTLQGHKDAPLSPKCQQAPCQTSRAGIVHQHGQGCPAQADLLGCPPPMPSPKSASQEAQMGLHMPEERRRAQHHASAATYSTLLKLL